MQVLRPYRSMSLMELAVTPPIFSLQTILIMLTPDGQSPCCCKCKAIESQSKITEETIDSGNWTQSQIELLKLIYFHGAKEMAKSLKLVHHIALYHSDFPLDEDEKSSLYDVITLSKSLKRIKAVNI